MFIHPHPVTIPLHGQSTDICGQAAAKKRHFQRNIQSYLWNEGTYACSKHHFTRGCILGEHLVAGACNWFCLFDSGATLRLHPAWDWLYMLATVISLCTATLETMDCYWSPIISTPVQVCAVAVESYLMFVFSVLVQSQPTSRQQMMKETPAKDAVAI